MSNQLQITGGGKVRNLEGVITGTSGVLSSVPLGAANGVATLDSGGKVPVSQLPSSVVTYLGTWNAATNTPTLVNGTGDAGDMYICNVAGTVNFGAGPVVFVVGDWVLYGSGTWQKSSGQNGTVTSVGLSTNAGAITIGNSPISTSGTITANFNGTNLQYVNGAGNLTTFPILTGYVPYTGATQDVDLGAFKLNAQSLHIKGTAGNGHLGLKHQSASATASANEVSLFADSLGDLAWQNGNLYLSKFITSGNTAARSYTFPNANGTVALTSDLANYVDLTTAQTIGGTKTFTDATKNNGGIFLQNASSSSLAGYMNIGGLTNGVKFTSGGGISNTFTLPSATGYTFTFPSATGTVVLGSGTIGAVAYFNANGSVVNGSSNHYWDNANNRLGIANSSPSYNLDVTGTGRFTGQLILGSTINNGTYTYTLPSATGTIALTSDLTGGTVTSVAMTVPTGLSVSGSPITTSGTLAVSLASGYSIPTTASQTNWDTAYTNRITSATAPLSIISNVIAMSEATGSVDGYLSRFDWTTFNNKQATITLTTTGTSGAATFTSNTLNIPNYGSALSGYLPLTGGTLTGALGGTSASFSSSVSAGDSISTSYGTARIQVTSTTNSANSGFRLSAKNSSGTTKNAGLYFISGTASENTYLALYADDNNPQFIVSSSGNAGLGVTPSAWGSSFTALQVKNASFWSTGNDASITSNAYYDGTNYKYIATSGATKVYHNTDGSINWAQAASGTAGAAITFTQAMTLTAAGRLLINTPTESTYQLDVNGTGRFSSSVTGGAFLSSGTGYDTATSAEIQLNNTTTTTGRTFVLNSYNSGGFQIADKTASGATRFSIASTGAATFSSTSGVPVSVTSTAATSTFVLDNTNANLWGGVYAVRVNGVDKNYFGTLGSLLGTTNTDATIWATSGNGFRVYTNGNNNRLQVFSNGGVGINTGGTDAGYQLDVNGTGRFSSTVTATSYNRSAAGTGFLNGKYAGAENTTTTGPIYCIGDSYTPTSTSLNTMYGIGYSYNNFTGKYGPSDTWGMYIAANGSANIFLGGSGAGYFNSTVTASGFFESSDKRIKTLIEDNYQTKGIGEITPKLYTKNGKVELGYYAQDFIGILDSAISKIDDGMLNLSYREVHTAKIYALEQRIKELESKLN